MILIIIIITRIIIIRIIIRIIKISTKKIKKDTVTHTGFWWQEGEVIIQIFGNLTLGGSFYNWELSGSFYYYYF